MLCRLKFFYCSWLHAGIQIQIPGLHFVISCCCCSSVQTLNCWDGQKRMRPHSARRPGLWEDHWRTEKNFILSCNVFFLSLVTVQHLSAHTNHHIWFHKKQLTHWSKNASFILFLLIWERIYSPHLSPLPPSTPSTPNKPGNQNVFQELQRKC